MAVFELCQVAIDVTSDCVLSDQTAVAVNCLLAPTDGEEPATSTLATVRPGAVGVGE